MIFKTGFCNHNHRYYHSNQPLKIDSATLKSHWKLGRLNKCKIRLKGMLWISKEM